MENFWTKLTDEHQLNEIINSERKSLIFKHSTRCSISSTALNRIESKWDNNDSEHFQAFYLDLIAYRSLSNKIAELFNVTHESPQLLLINNGKCYYNASHFDINIEDCRKEIS